MMFNIYSILPFSIGLIFSFVGFIIYYKNRKSTLNILFGLECLSTVIWLFSYAAMYTCKDRLTAYLWARLVYTGVIMIPIFFYHFSIELLQINSSIEKIWTKIIYVTGIAFLFLLYFTRSFIAGTYKYYWGYYSKAGIFHHLFLIFLLIICTRSFVLLYKNYLLTRVASPIKSNQIRYVFWAFVIAFVLGSTDFLPLYGFEYYPVGSIFIAIGLGTIAYTILKYRLMDINIALTRVSLFTIVYTLVLGVPFVIGAKIFTKESSLWFLPMSLLAIFASAGPFLYVRLQKRVEARLRAEEFKAQNQLRTLSHNILRFTNLEGLLKLIVHQLIKIFKLKFVAIYLIDKQNNKYVLKSSWQFLESSQFPLAFSMDSSLIKEINSRKLSLISEELKLNRTNRSGELITILSELKINTIIPSFMREELFGFMILSDRRNNAPFTQEDLNLLTVLSNEAALAIENAQFHQKERSVLAEESMREALANMAPGVSHQFNNRLAAISSTTELLLLKLDNIDVDSEKDENIKSVLKDTKEALAMIDGEVFKGKEITSAILKRAKAKKEFHDIDIKSIIDNAYKLVSISRTKTGINMPDFKMNVLNEIPLIFGSEALLQDCFYNFIDNSSDAIQDKIRLISRGSLNIPDYKGDIEVTIKYDNGTLKINVKDNGVGMKKEDLKKLFTPYFTTKATSDKGTGLGLYIIRNFIEMHKGTIICDSEYGAGTTFTIRLPIKKNNNHPNLGVNKMNVSYGEN